MVVHNQNKESKKLFSDITIIDWYDGATLAVAKMVQSPKWYLASMVYISFETGERIFQLIEVDEAWAGAIEKDIHTTNYSLIRKRIEDMFLQYSSDLYLAKGQNLHDSGLEIRKIPVNNLKYYSDIKEINEDMLAARKWIAFFK